jgi:hypothetical protein
MALTLQLSAGRQASRKWPQQGQAVALRRPDAQHSSSLPSSAYATEAPPLTGAVLLLLLLAC